MVSGQSVGVQQVVPGQQIQTVSNHVPQTNMVATATATPVKAPVPNQPVPVPPSGLTTPSNTPTVSVCLFIYISYFLFCVLSS